MRIAVVACFAGVLSGCASLSAAPGATENDPFESANRSIHAFNKGVDTVALRPAAQIYDAVTPGLARHLIGNAINHLQTPMDALNALLQGNIDGALKSVGRFGLNTLVGAAGLLDPATEFGLPKQYEDFGQTLGVWGVAEGPYLELPLLGPSTARDAAGKIVDMATDPLTWLGPAFKVPTGVSVGRKALELVETRADYMKAVDGALYGSADSYAVSRSLYLQSRRSYVVNGAEPAHADIYDAEKPF